MSSLRICGACRALTSVLSLVAIALFITVAQSSQRVNATAEAIPGTVADTMRIAVGSGNFHACAIDSNNGVKCWPTSSSDSNTYGQLGQGNTNTYTGPRTVSGLSSGVKQIAVGNTHACAVLSADGSVKCWGRNYEGALGNGLASTGNASATPTNVITTSNANLTGVSDISTFDDHTCAVKSGAVLCWGYNIGGMGITGNTNGTLLKATQVLASGAESVAVGNDSSCALMTDATVKCWGTGGRGQMGNSGATNFNNPPATVSGLSDVVAVSVGQGAVCALRGNGNIHCWGNNLFGVVGNGICGLGTGTGEKSTTPVGPINTYIGVASGEKVVAISLSYSEGIALTDTGRTIYWGGNTGPCRAGSTWQQSLPSGVTVVGISASGTSLYQSCYVRSDAVIKCAGETATGVTPLGADAPGTPAAPTVIGGDGQATITVTPPQTGGTPTSYTVTASPGGATCTVTPPDTDCTITGLTNGTAYTFTTTATNAFGSSSSSSQSSPVTPLAPPGTPGTPTATAGNGQATITVTPPQTGGTPTSYTVTASPGGATCTVTPPDTDCTITGLTNGTAYTFTTTATNASGTSAQSPSSSPVTPRAGGSNSGSPTQSATTTTIGQSSSGGVNSPSREQAQTFSVTRLVPSGQVAPGNRYSLVASGFKPGEDVHAFVVGSAQSLGVSKASSSGSIRVDVRIPSSMTGEKTLVLFGASSRTGVRQLVMVTPDAAVPDEVGNLSGSGQSTLPLVWLAALLLGIGTLTRRRAYT